MSLRFSPGNVASKPAFDNASRNFDFSNPDGTSTVAVFALVSTETFETPATEASAFFTGGAHEAQSMPMTLNVSLSANAGAATRMVRSRIRFMRRLTQAAAEAIQAGSRFAGGLVELANIEARTDRELCDVANDRVLPLTVLA